MSRDAESSPPRGVVSPREIDAMVEATRVVGALIAESLARMEPPVTMPQWRVLVLAAGEGCNLSAVAEDLEVHPSNATRICDRLVRAGLLKRQKDAADGRQVRLTLTPSGHRLHDAAMAYRQERVQRAMVHIGQRDRSAVAAAVVRFATALEAARPERDGEPRRH